MIAYVFDRLSFGLFITCTLIFALGLVMVYNTSSAEILDRFLDKSVESALTRQIGYAAVGLFLGFLVYKIGYEELIRWAMPLFCLGLFLLLLVFIPGIGKAKGGAHRWIGAGGFSFQPSEFMKYAIPLVYIGAISKNSEILTRFYPFSKLMAILGFGILLVIIEPDNGTAFVMASSLVPLFFLSHARARLWAFPLLGMALLASIFALSHPYVRGRLEVFIHPEKDLRGKGHQPHQAKIAAGSGKLFGKGIGASIQKFTYLPEAQNDYIAAIFAEECGFLGILFLILLYMLFTFFGFAIGFNAQDERAKLLAFAITFLISFQSFLNLGVASSLLPSKGVNLPFFSQGGTSLIANLMGVATLLDISRNGRDEKDSS